MTQELKKSDSTTRKMFSKIGLIANKAYGSYLDQFKSPNVLIFAEDDVTFGELKTIIKFNDENFKEPVLWLAFTGIYSIADYCKFNLCKSSYCENVIDSLELEKDYCDSRTSSSILSSLIDIILALQKQVKSSCLTEGSDFLMMPPLPISILTNKYLTHNQIHSRLSRSEECFVVVDEDHLTTITDVYVTFCTNVWNVLVDLSHPPYQHFLLEYKHMDYANVLIDAEGKCNCMKLYARNIKQLIRNSLSEEQPLKSLPAETSIPLTKTDKYDQTIFIGNHTILKHLSLANSSDCTIFNVKFPLNWVEVREGLPAYKSKYKKILFIIVTDMSIITTKKVDEDCQSCSSELKLSYVCMESESVDFLIRNNIQRIVGIKRKLEEYFKDKNCVLVAPLFPRLGIRKPYVKSLSFHNLMHKVAVHASSPLFLDGQMSMWDKSLAILNESWQEHFESRNSPFYLLDKEENNAYKISPLSWQLCSEFSLEEKSALVEKWEERVKEVTSASSLIAQLATDDEMQTANNIKASPKPGDFSSTVVSKVETNNDDVKFVPPSDKVNEFATTGYVIGGSNFLNVLDDLRHFENVHFFKKSFPNAFSLDIADLLCELGTVHSSNVYFIVFDISYITTESRLDWQCTQQKCNTIHVALNMPIIGGVSKANIDKYIQNCITEIDTFLKTFNRYALALPLPLPPSQIFLNSVVVTGNHLDLEWIYKQAHFATGRTIKWELALSSFQEHWSDLLIGYYSRFTNSSSIVTDYLKKIKDSTVFKISMHEDDFTGDISAYESWINTVNNLVLTVTRKDMNSGKQISHPDVKFKSPTPLGVGGSPPQVEQPKEEVDKLQLNVTNPPQNTPSPAGIPKLKPDVLSQNQNASQSPASKPNLQEEVLSQPQNTSPVPAGLPNLQEKVLSQPKNTSPSPAGMPNLKQDVLSQPQNTSQSPASKPNLQETVLSQPQNTSPSPASKPNLQQKVPSQPQNTSQNQSMQNFQSNDVQQICTIETPFSQRRPHMQKSAPGHIQNKSQHQMRNHQSSLGQFRNTPRDQMDSAQGRFQNTSRDQIGMQQSAQGQFQHTYQNQIGMQQGVLVQFQHTSQKQMGIQQSNLGQFQNAPMQQSNLVPFPNAPQNQIGMQQSTLGQYQNQMGMQQMQPNRAPLAHNMHPDNGPLANNMHHMAGNVQQPMHYMNDCRPSFQSYSHDHTEIRRQTFHNQVTPFNYTQQQGYYPQNSTCGNTQQSVMMVDQTNSSHGAMQSYTNVQTKLSATVGNPAQLRDGSKTRMINDPFGEGVRQALTVDITGFSTNFPIKLLLDFACDASKQARVIEEKSDYLKIQFPYGKALAIIKTLSHKRIGDSYIEAKSPHAPTMKPDLPNDQKDVFISNIYNRVYSKWSQAITAGMEKQLLVGLDVATFKSRKCFSECNNSENCNDYHWPGDRRRNPLKYTYCADMCERVKNEDGVCNKGQTCSYSHNLYEQMYHPNNFQTVLCVSSKTDEGCSKYPFCKFAHTDSPEMFFTKFWSDLIVFGLPNSFLYIAGAIKATLKLPHSESIKIFCVGPDKEFLKLLKMSLKQIAKDYSMSVLLLDGKDNKEGVANIYLGTPSSFMATSMMRLHNKFKLQLSALIIDDVEAIFRDDRETESLHSFFQRFRSSPLNFTSIQKVFVVAEYNEKAVGTISRFFGVNLKPVKKKYVKATTASQKNETKWKYTPTDNKVSVVENKEEKNKLPVASIGKKAEILDKILDFIEKKSHNKTSDRNEKTTSVREHQQQSAYIEEKQKLILQKFKIEPLKSTTHKDKSRMFEPAKSTTHKDHHSQKSRMFEPAKSTTHKDHHSQKSRMFEPVKSTTHKDHHSQKSRMFEPAKSTTLEDEFRQKRKASLDAKNDNKIQKTSAWQTISHQREEPKYNSRIKESSSENQDREMTDFFIAKLKLIKEHEEETRVFRELPEIHPDYEKIYEGFLNYYRKKFGRKRNETHLNSKWEEYWEKHLNSINNDHLQKKIQRLRETLDISSESKQKTSTSASIPTSDDEFTVSKTLDILEEFKDKFGVLGHSLQEMINFARKSGTETDEALEVFADPEHAQLCQIIIEKMRGLKSASRYTAPIYDLAIKWTNELLKKAVNNKKQDNISVEAIAKSTLGKGPAFTLDVIKHKLIKEGHTKPPKDLVNKLFLEVCSAHFNVTMEND